MAGRKKRQISPAYPFYGLKQAASFLEKFYRVAGESEVSKENASRYMGLEPGKPDTHRAFSALTTFGLLDERVSASGRSIRISELGRSILTKDGESRQRTGALQGAAYNYGIIRKLRIRWPKGLADDESVINALVLDHKFNKRAAKSFLPALKETYAFAKLSVDSNLQLDANENLGTEVEMSTSNQSVNAPEYKLSLGANKQIRFFTSDKLTNEEVDFVCQWIKRLDITKDENQSNAASLEEEIPF